MLGTTYHPGWIVVPDPLRRGFGKDDYCICIPGCASMDLGRNKEYGN